MSLSIDLYESTIDDYVHELDITNNLKEMAYACGLYGAMWRPHRVIGVDDKDEGTVVVRAKDIITQLEAGINELSHRPEEYEQYNPSNGWGSIGGLLIIAIKYKNACIKYPDAIIHVSR